MCRVKGTEMPQGWGVDSKGLVRNHVKNPRLPSNATTGEDTPFAVEVQELSHFNFVFFYPCILSARQVSSSSEEVFYGPVYP